MVRQVGEVAEVVDQLLPVLRLPVRVVVLPVAVQLEEEVEAVRLPPVRFAPVALADLPLLRQRVVVVRVVRLPVLREPLVRQVPRADMVDPVVEVVRTTLEVPVVPVALAELRVVVEVAEEVETRPPVVWVVQVPVVKSVFGRSVALALTWPKSIQPTTSILRKVMLLPLILTLRMA